MTPVSARTPARSAVPAHQPLPGARWLWACAVCVGACISGAQAQGIYKVVKPDGTVTFSDQPPSVPTQAPVVVLPKARRGGNAAPDLPYALRQTVSKYPVTLYTTAPCSTCDAGRALLKNRGIPFTERTVSTPEDTETLGKLVGEALLPTATIGTQTLKGLNESDWNQYLDAAGYPPNSVLPPTYRPADATPLVPRPSSPRPPADKAPPKPAAVPVVPPLKAPSGIQF